MSRFFSNRFITNKKNCIAFYFATICPLNFYCYALTNDNNKCSVFYWKKNKKQKILFKILLLE